MCVFVPQEKAVGCRCPRVTQPLIALPTEPCCVCAFVSDLKAASTTSSLVSPGRVIRDFERKVLEWKGSNGTTASTRSPPTTAVAYQLVCKL